MRSMPQYLTECVKYLFDNYVQATKGPFADSSVGEYVRNMIPQNFIKSGLIDKTNYRIKASVGQGIWAQVPWIGIFRNDITDSAQNGVYIVYLLSADGNSLFLTFNQGFTDIAKDKTAKETVDEMRKRASDCISKLNKHSFRSDENISLGSNLTNRAEMYQKGTIFYKEYQKQNLPSEESLRRDLKDMLEIYEEYYEKIYKGKDNFGSEPIIDSNKENVTMQTIFFGAPGTGKSRKIDCNLFKDENGKPIGKGIKEIPEDRKFRTTFHPDYDYAQFVGAYKPKKEGNAITYSFVPQVFAKAYAAAWKQYFAAGNASTADNQVYLVIEEINRGNCAQIFGDIFQLLDRDGEGFSQYSIDADCDFATWLKEDSILKTVWSDYEAKVGEGKLKLPPNLNILATMNTSDQSLFPMDSAFKRRFDWEYVPIKYAKDSDCGDDWKADEFKIVIGNSTYMWLDFLKKVNADIYDATQSEDKQMGEFFIKPKSDDLKIAFNEFRSKVLFYLWDSVYKDETERQAVFHFPYGDGDGKINSVTFQSLFGKDAEAIVNKIMENLKVEKVTA
ncbi:MULTISPECIES: DUF3578 domain-containing protein [unclassified Fibrobacter]|uniref:MrcB family domain-containing protein n=1 Tax=unclassified Fibrobacter TaxID=2634177 RepID=UPI0025BCC158|nr:MULTISPECIES: DUF3578 domain-containing protein [unclassified Fibrobacter]